MGVELVETTYWSKIAFEINRDFGDGITNKLIADYLPVKIEDVEPVSIYLVPRNWSGIIEDKISNLDIYSLGLWFGDVYQNRFRLSLPILNPLAKLTSNIIHVKQIAAESFTYGRSILKESVIDIDESLKRHQRVIVLNEKDDVLGLAELVTDAIRVSDMKDDDLIAKNLIDIGWYIRKLG
ncbi:hypothetical protein EU537_07725 [Candidatus Thorarchaeota archaeon]|nr:MAG: hypothetical protein EU537_07725 [Candidatus Thorarchaeota archaeon]